MLEIMLTTPIAEKDGNKIYMSDEIIRANLETILSAQSTTTSMLSWSLNYLYDWSLGNTDALYKLIQEVDCLSGGDRCYQPSLDDVYNNMPYTTWVLWESIRMCPPIPTVLRHCMKTCNVGGYLIKRGTTVMVSTLGTHLNPKSFDNPLEYLPDRWADPNCKKHSCSYIPWAVGRRQCIGREFAMLTGRIGLFLLLNQFTLELSPKSKVTVDEHLFVFPSGLKLKAKPRSSTIKPLQPKPIEKQEEQEQKQEKQEEKQINSTENDHNNWNGLINLIRKENYKIQIINGTNTQNGTVNQVSSWFTNKATKFGFQINNSPISGNDLVKQIQNHEIPNEFIIWVIVTASYNGKSPKNFVKFYNWINEKVKENGNENLLSNVHFFVFGCGNTNWLTTYQKIPNQIEENLKKLGAHEIIEKADLNEAEQEWEDVLRDYYKQMAPKLMHSLPSIGDRKLRHVNQEYGGNNKSLPKNASKDEKEDFSRESKLEAQPNSSKTELKVIGSSNDDENIDYFPSFQNIELGKACTIKSIRNETKNSDRITLHIELDATGLIYSPGDHLIVSPCISNEYGERVLKHFIDYDLDTIISYISFQSSSSSNVNDKFQFPMEKNLTIENIFTSLVDLKAKPSKQFLINYSTIVHSDSHRIELENIVHDKQSYLNWILENQPLSIVDVIDKYPPNENEFDRLIRIIPSLQPRSYSITSCPKVSFILKFNFFCLLYYEI